MLTSCCISFLGAGDSVLRYINGEWLNVSAKCKRQKNLGYFDASYCDDDEYHDNLAYAYDQREPQHQMEVDADDYDDVEGLDLCSARYRRPDAFWMGDGFRKEEQRSMYTKLRPRRTSMSHRIRHYGDNSSNYDDQSDARRALYNRYSTFYPTTWAGRHLHDCSRVYRAAHVLSPSPSMSHPIYRNHQPYVRPMATATVEATSSRMWDDDPRRKIVTKFCGCGSSSAEPILKQMDPIALPMQRHKPIEKSLIKNDPDKETGTTGKEIEHKIDGRKTLIENDTKNGLESATENNTM